MHFPRNGSRRCGRRLTALAARWSISAALLLVAFAALLAPPLPAQAQTATTLVSNLEQTDTSGSTSQLAQAFDTGSNAAGYELTSVTLRLVGAEQNPGRGALVRITPATSSGPDLSDSTKIITLTTPTLTTDTDNVFTAPAGATLDADSTYMVVVTSADGTDGNRFPVGRTRSTGTDSSTATPSGTLPIPGSSETTIQIPGLQAAPFSSSRYRAPPASAPPRSPRTGA